MPFGYKVAESAIPNRIFWLLWKMAYTLTRETEMTVADMGLVLCAAAALEIEKKKKKKDRRRSEKTSASKKKKKTEGLVEKKSPTGPQHDFAIRTGGRRFASFKNYLRMDPDTFNEILKRMLYLGFKDGRILLVKWLKRASSDLLSSETAGVGCLGLEYCFFFFAGLDWLTSISLPSESSSGGGRIRFWVAFFPIHTFF